eukprot:6303975-Pyramimonas_sp.AAC.1
MRVCAVVWALLTLSLPLSESQWQELKVLFVGDSQCGHMGNTFYTEMSKRTNDQLALRGAPVYATFFFDCVSWRRIGSCHGNDLHACGPPSATTGPGAVLEHCETQQADIVVSLIGVNNCKLFEVGRNGQSAAWWHAQIPADIQEFSDATNACGPNTKWMAFGSFPGNE